MQNHDHWSKLSAKSSVKRSLILRAYLSACKKKLPSLVLKIWQRRGIVACLLWPLAQIFAISVALRRYAFMHGYLRSWHLPVPIIIIGNINVGGSGKTPIVIALAQALHRAGLKPGVITRGYQGRQHHTRHAHLITLNDHALDVGDEAVLLARKLAPSAIPICAHPHRVECAQFLLAHYPEVNVLISDDGLQHYRLARSPQRDIEIVVSDRRLLGNRWPLPAGPLREPLTRSRDFTLIPNATAEDNLTLPASIADSPCFMTRFEISHAWHLNNPSEQRPLHQFAHLQAPTVLAAAGIGYPEKFFHALRQHHLQFHALELPDHFDFVENPFLHSKAQTIFITEKDAVKCMQLNDHRIWVVPVNATLDPCFIKEILQRLVNTNA